MNIENTPIFLKGTKRTGGDGWKDPQPKGAITYVVNYELPKPHKEGQYPRIGYSSWTASKDDFDFKPATITQVNEYLVLLRTAHNQRLSDLLNKVGVCDDCGKHYSHEITEPFAHCGCGTSEWHTLTPYMQLERINHYLIKHIKNLEESIRDGNSDQAYESLRALPDDIRESLKELETKQCVN